LWAHCRPTEATLVFAAAIVDPLRRAFESAGAMIVLIGLALYAAAGVAVAGAFVVLGVTRVLPEPAPVTVGARVLIFPGAVALWPYVLVRWLTSHR
jgi:hypothetical protein